MPPSTIEPEVVDVESKPLADMTPVREFFVGNVAGRLGATLEVANDPEEAPIRGNGRQLIPPEPW